MIFYILNYSIKPIMTMTFSKVFTYNVLLFSAFRELKIPPTTPPARRIPVSIFSFIELINVLIS